MIKARTLLPAFSLFYSAENFIMATILHIDHSEAAQKSVQATLGLHHNVVSATDGPTAIQYCAMIQPDLILIDAELPGVNGYQLVSRLKMFMPKTPILLLATRPGNGQLQKLKSRSDGCLTKPINENVLWETVQSLLPQPAKFPPIITLPDQVVNQFENQIAALNQANRRLASLNAVSALIGTSLDLKHLTGDVLDQIQRTIDFDSATLFLLKGNILEAVGSRGLLEHRQGMNIYRKNDKNSAWQVVNNKLPLIINDVTASDYWESRPELDRVRSWLGIPLIYKDRVVGVLTLDKNQPEAFVDADARYLFTLAYQIAIAVENAQLFEEWENQATRLKLINEVAQEITTILNVENLFHTLARIIIDRLPYERVSIYERGEGDTAFMLGAQYSKLVNQPRPIAISFIRKIAKVDRPFIINDTTQEQDMALVVDAHIRSIMVIPVFVGSRAEAIITVESSHINRFKDQDLWTLSSLAGQAATVIHNAQLYHDIGAYSDKLERIVAARTQRLQAIRKISQVVSQGFDVDDLLVMASQGISQIFTLNNSPTPATVVIGLVNGSHLVKRSIYDNTLHHPENFDTHKVLPNLPAGQVIGQSRPKILNNYNPQAIFDTSATLEGEFKNSIMLAPLITAGKTIGIVIVESQPPNSFDESDLETLETLAFQIASGIEHARLLRKTRELAIVDERTRLARDMHDGIAQNLAYLLIQVDRCLNMVDEDSNVAQHLERVSSLLTQNIDELRRNIFDLRPVELEGRSLFEVLENFVIEFGRRWNVQTTCLITGQVDNVLTEVERALYRILQETLSNARQHAHCTHITVKLTVENNRWIILDVTDDGQGFDTGQSRQNKDKKGLGLISMRERAASVGGQLHVESAKEQGTRIVSKLPLNQVIES